MEPSRGIGRSAEIAVRRGGMRDGDTIGAFLASY